jgi:hypothetical protein
MVTSRSLIGGAVGAEVARPKRSDFTRYWYFITTSLSCIFDYLDVFLVVEQDGYVSC